MKKAYLKTGASLKLVIPKGTRGSDLLLEWLAEHPVKVEKIYNQRGDDEIRVRLFAPLFEYLDCVAYINANL